MLLAAFAVANAAPRTAAAEPDPRGGAGGAGRAAARGPDLEAAADELLDRLVARTAAGSTTTWPTITLEGDANGAPHPDPGIYRAKFSGKYAHRSISGGGGHNLLQEAPRAFAQAVADVDPY
ncbi:MAG: alpha/beta hydrolase fold protein [Actinomycetia bacterium]|nr:alpha/beta hydrolase fold protein [Actinomycetes bacterium]